MGMAEFGSAAGSPADGASVALIMTSLSPILCVQNASLDAARRRSAK
jgi:hypothetical protein